MKVVFGRVKEVLGRAGEVIIWENDLLGAIKEPLERLRDNLGPVNDIPEAFTDIDKCTCGLHGLIRGLRPERAYGRGTHNRRTPYVFP